MVSVNAQVRLVSHKQEMEGVIKFQYLKAEKVSSKESGRVFRAENFAMQLSLKEVIRER